MGLSKFEVEVSPGGGRVVVDGDDISEHIRAVEIVAAVTEVPTLVLHTFATGTVKGEGFVQVVSAGLTAAIQDLDAESIEQEVLNRSGWGDGRNAIQITVDVIKEILTDATES